VTSPILTIVGPTASGKTDFALRLAKRGKFELVSADSRQIYKHLSVGTAKPSGIWKDDRYWVEGIPFHLLDHHDPAEAYNAQDFVKEATVCIENIRSRGNEPILVGGTGFYLKALQNGLAALPAANDAYRLRMKQLAEEKGRPHLHQMLHAVDPISAAAIPANNIHRLIRALEVYELTGKPLSTWHKEHQAETHFGIKLRCIGIKWERETLDERIRIRTHQMMRDGWVQETTSLLEKGYSETCPALTSLGYRTIVASVHTPISQPSLEEKIYLETRQYAKRQRTWFQHQLAVEWLTTLTIQPINGTWLRRSLRLIT
jgi:tRNA dimethylallyltransferase